MTSNQFNICSLPDDDPERQYLNSVQGKNKSVRGLLAAEID
jgi:hypothetical protein